MTILRTLPLVAILYAMPVPALAQHSHGHDGHAAHPAGREAHSPELRAQVEAVRAATERYRDHASAVRDGYRLFGSEGALMGEHWYHPELTKAPLDLARPSTLQYATIGGRKVLVGVAYTVYRRPGEPEPEGFAGALDRWHTHDVARLARAAVAERPLLRSIVNRRIERGRVGAGDGRTLLTMVHAWVWLENPDGLFADQHRALPYLRAGLPAEWAAGAGEAAAQGVALLADGGCRREVERTDRLARLGRDEERALAAACARSAADVRTVVGRDRDAAAVNRAAAGAWERYLGERRRVLTPEQAQRMERVMGAVTEGHGVM